ncbi:MAG: helix-turn-helix transcriptional regulator [Lentisphaeria bacterium]|nr:helix-turn-helix transcriptional regulator [Lentisphaeria bacterium]
MADCRRLREPAGYFNGIVGGRQDAPDNILLLHRCPEMRISRAHDADKLYHRRYVLTLNMKAEGLVCVNEKSFPLPEEYAALTYPYQSHCYVVDQNLFDWLIVTFESSAPPPPGLMYRSTRLNGSCWGLALRICELYREVFAEFSASGAELLQGLLQGLLLELLHARDFVDAENRPQEEGNGRVHLFEQLNGYIFKHLSEPELSLEELAARHFISPALLHLVFRQMAGCTPGKYIRDIRIKQAQKLLDQREVQIAEIAERTGFSSPAVFSRCFRRVIGLSPSEYAARSFPGSRTGAGVPE